MLFRQLLPMRSVSGVQIVARGRKTSREKILRAEKKQELGESPLIFSPLSIFIAPSQLSERLKQTNLCKTQN